MKCPSDALDARWRQPRKLDKTETLKLEDVPMAPRSADRRTPHWWNGYASGVPAENLLPACLCAGQLLCNSEMLSVEWENRCSSDIEELYLQSKEFLPKLPVIDAQFIVVFVFERFSKFCGNVSDEVVKCI